jgi:hypothetical protein
VALRPVGGAVHVFGVTFSGEIWKYPKIRSTGACGGGAWFRDHAEPPH